MRLLFIHLASGWETGFAPSPSKKNQPAICWLSSKPTPRRSDRKEQHMNNIRKALRYIYIYRLNLAKAGWAYDRQSREVWRGKREATRSYGRKHLFYKLYRVVCKEWRVCIRKCLHQRGNNANRRQWEPFLGVSKREKPVIPQLSKSLYKSDGLYSIFFVQDGGIPSRRLTSKEVAA